MAATTLTLRNTKGSPLTNTEMDTNISLLNSYCKGYLSKSITTNTTLTDLEADNYFLAFSGTLSANATITLPSILVKSWTIYNGTTGGFSIIVKYSTGAGATILNGIRTSVYFDGTDMQSIGGTAALATSLTGGLIGSIPYQSAAGVTAMLPSGTTGQILTATTGGAPTWAAAPASGATITDDLTTNVNQYLGMSRSTSGAWLNAYTASTELFFNPYTGTTYSTIFQSLSDKNKKTNINTIENALDIVENINGVTFDWIDSGLPSVGLIAQDVEKYLPELVTENEGTKSLNYNGVIGVLVEAIKELSERIRVLESK